MNDKPSVLVLGATGFIGRNLVDYLISNNLANVTAVDKQLPNCAYLSPEEEKLFEQANFVQKNLVNPGMFLVVEETRTYRIVTLNLLFFFCFL